MPKSSVSFAFDHTSPEALAWAKDQAASLLSTIADREQVRSIIARAFSEHMTPQAAASLIRSVVGLTGPQTQAMLNLRSLLDPTSPTYAGDGALVYAGKTAIRIPEDGFDADMIDQRVEEYSDRLINQRARMIARTELIGASNAGTQEAWQQAVDEGLLTGGERREWMWVEGLDKVPCPTCSEMDGQRVELDAPFISPDGEEIMNPPAHPNCRCGQGLVTEAERQQEVADQTDEEASLETASAFLDDFPSAVTYEEWRDAIIAEQRGLIDVDAAERDLGGPGSGNFGHAGRPGEVGGSSTGGESGLTSKSSLTEGERETLSGYTFSPDVNDDLRQGKETDVSKTLDAVMAKSTLTKDQVLYRLVSEEQFAKLGVEFNDKGYLSTASTMEGLKEVQAALYQGDPNDSVFEHGVLRYENEDGDVDVQHVVELHVPAGTHAVDVNQNLGSKHEFSDAKEVLLDRDLTFTVSHRPDGTAILTKKDARALGGSGSGFFGHAGRPGEVGGSSEGDEHLTVENRIGDKVKMFVAAVQGQLSAIPADMRLAGGASSNAIIRDRPKNVPSTAQAHFQAIGGGSPSGYIYLYPRRGDDPVEVAGNAVHEYGHAVDLHLGGGKFWSDDPEFGAALKKDAATLNDKDRHWVYSHVISSNKEAFAEAFAALAGAQGRPESNEVFQQKFPTVTAWVRGVLKRKSS